MSDYAARLMALADELSAKLDSETEDRQLMCEHAERTVRQIAADMGATAAPAKLLLDGNDNYGKPRQVFADKLAAATDAEFVEIAKDRIWLSAYADNNPRSDHHWQADACYTEALRRGDESLYRQAWEQVAESAR